jgi:hypothetical protein
MDATGQPSTWRCSLQAIAIARADGTSDVLGAAQWTTWTCNAHHELSAQDGPTRSLAYAVMRALLRILDSKFLSRVGNFDVLVKVVGLGATIVIAIVLVAAGVVEVGGWIPLVCFAVWTLFSALLIATGMLRAGPHAFTSPAARIAMKARLPGVAERVVVALNAAQKEGRELIADIAVFDTLNKSGGGFAQRIAMYRGEVAELIGSTDLLNDDWALLWDRVPRNVPIGVSYGPMTLGQADEIVSWLRYKMWQLDWMVTYVQTGDDKPVRHIRIRVAAYDSEAKTGPGASELPSASRPGDPLARAD